MNACLKRLLFLSFTLQIWLPARAQEAIGLNPPSMKWRQIATPAGRIIFPEGLDSVAFRAAGIMAWQRLHDSAIVGSGKTKPVPTIIQNQSAMPAGFSTPAPWRNEFYITPPQNLFTGPTPWLTYLTTHEYRHAQQFHMANQGAVLPFKILMGQTGWLLNALVNQPLWFREGDAVIAETELTNAGRGRMPRFHMETRAMLLSGLKYNFEKANFPASFRDFVPNPYRLGYYLTTHARRKYDPAIWQKVLHRTHHRVPFYAFSRSLKDQTGLNTSQLYQETMQELENRWQLGQDSLSLTPATVISPPGSSNYTNYRFPHFRPDGSVIVLKDGFDQIRSFYQILPGGKEEKLVTHGVYTEDHVMLSSAGDLMTWAESAFDERWINQDFSVVKTYHFSTGKVRKITSRSRYFAPAPSPDGTRIVAVEASKENRYNLVLLDAVSGEKLQELPNPDNVFLAQPRFSQNGENIIALAITAAGNSLIEVSPETGVITTLLPFTNVPLSRPLPHGEHLYFAAGFTGIDNIYALHRPTGKIFQVTSVPFGAYEPTVSADGKKLIYSSYTARGYRLEETELNPKKWTELLPEQYQSTLFQEFLPEQPKAPNLAAANFPGAYQVRKYRAFSDELFNIYGWFPSFGNNQYGADFYTRNLMSTLRGTIGVFYNTNEAAIGSKVNLSYAALYPVIDLEAGLRTRKRAEIRTADDREILQQEWSEKYASAGLRFPFRLTQGKYLTNMEMGGALARYEVNFLDSLAENVHTTAGFNAYQANFNFSRLLLRARQQVQPRWGQTLQASYQKAINAEPERFLLGTSWFFPGFHRTHSLNFRGAWKREAVQQTYRFSDAFVMPRGYRPDPFRQMLVISGNYEFPFWYPDLAAGPVAFFQRCRGNLFFDYAKVRHHSLEGNLNSTGAELLLDVRFLRLFSTTIAFRYSHTFNTELAGTIPFQFLITRFELAN